MKEIENTYAQAKIPRRKEEGGVGTPFGDALVEFDFLPGKFWSGIYHSHSLFHTKLYCSCVSSKWCVVAGKCRTRGVTTNALIAFCFIPAPSMIRFRLADGRARSNCVMEPQWRWKGMCLPDAVSEYTKCVVISFCMAYSSNWFTLWVANFFVGGVIPSSPNVSFFTLCSKKRKRIWNMKIRLSGIWCFGRIF